MTTAKRVLVVGAGIGGLSLAVALRKVNIDVDVIEKSEAMTVFGVGIIQPSNALRALQKIGLAEECVAAGAGFPGWRLYDRHGVMFAEVPNPNIAGPGMPPVNGIYRLELHRILERAAINAGARLSYGVTIADYDNEPDFVSVRFSDNGIASYDLVVAADGTFSAMRQDLFGAEPRPNFTGEGVWRCNFDRPADMQWGGMYYGEQSKAGLVPMSATRMYLFLVTAEPDKPRFRDEELVQALRERLSGYEGLIGELRGSIDDSSGVVYKPMETLLLPTPWHRGRIMIIGDAAHSTTPHLAQGASLAIEDAVVLAEMLAEGQPIPETLKAAGERRYARAKLIVESSVQLGEWEMAEWSGAPDPAASFGGLFKEATDKMMEPV